MGKRFRVVGIETRTGLALILPAVGFIFFVGLFPILKVLQFSLTRTDYFTAASNWVGLTNYVKALSDPAFWSASRHTAFYVFMSVSLHLLFGLGLSSILVHPLINERFRAIARSLLILPWTVTLVVSSLMGRLLLNPQFSVFAGVLRTFGIVWDNAILTDPKLALAGIVAVNVWNFTPFYMLMILAQMQSIPPALYEAVDVEGAKGWQKFLFITMPELKQILKFLVVFDVIGTFIQFDLVWLMTNGGPLGRTEVLATLAYRTAFERFDFNYSSTIGILMALFMLVFSGLILLLGNKEEV